MDALNIALTIIKHCWERLSQRHAGCNTGNILIPIRTLYLNSDDIPPEPGKYEFGVEVGIFILERLTYDGHTTAITFIDSDKLRPEQSAALGDIRKIRSIK